MSYDGNYKGQGVYDGPGWYGSDGGPILHCYSREYNKPDGPYGGKSRWFESREEAERRLNSPGKSKRNGGKRKYSRRRRGSKRTRSRK
jgi:hypothetical protein